MNTTNAFRTIFHVCTVRTYIPHTSPHALTKKVIYMSREEKEKIFICLRTNIIRSREIKGFMHNAHER